MNTAPKMHELIKTELRAARDIDDGCNRIMAVIESLAPPSGEGVEWVAKNHGDYWTVQVMCAAGPRDYVIRKADGALFELPDDRVPFVTLQRTTPQSAPVDLQRFRPAVSRFHNYARLKLQAVGNSLPEHYRPAIEAEVAEAAALLDLLDGLTPQSAPEDGDGDAVACKHEPYLGACVHCGVGFRNGVVVASPPTTTAEAFATLRQALDNSVCYCGVDPIAIVTLRQDEARRMLSALTTPPPASQERGECRCPEHGSWIAADDIHRMVRDLDVAMFGDGAAIQASLCDLMPHLLIRIGAYKAASPPSSAAESIPDFWVREDSLAAMAEDYVCDAAEQAKPDMAADDAFAAHIANLDQDELEAEQAKHDGPPVFFIRQDGTHGEYPPPAEQAQAVELDVSEAMMAADSAVCADEFDRWYASTGTKQWNIWGACEAAWNASRRLAGGVTVDDDMVERALIAYQSICYGCNTRALRAALVAAFGAK